MTSIAFVIAVFPLVIASGAGSGARQSLGTAIFGGMLISTFRNLVITPVLYVVIKGFELRGRDGKPNGRARGPFEEPETPARVPVTP
jgi:HAE1 family hydrophobic/amphiphilic exporter-1